MVACAAKSLNKEICLSVNGCTCLRTRVIIPTVGLTNARTCLEWEGVFAGKPVAGATIIARDDAGRSRACDCIIAPSIRSSHLPRRFRGASVDARLRRLGREELGRPLTTGSLSEQRCICALVEANCGAVQI